MSFESNTAAVFFFLSFVLGVPLIVVLLINKFKKRKRGRVRDE